MNIQYSALGDQSKAFHQRGIHDINNQITYEANDGFVFHDSGGFESGSSEEMRNVHAFIKARSEANTLKEQLHAIWYVLLHDCHTPECF